MMFYSIKMDMDRQSHAQKHPFPSVHKPPPTTPLHRKQFTRPKNEIFLLFFLREYFAVMLIHFPSRPRHGEVKMAMLRRRQHRRLWFAKEFIVICLRFYGFYLVHRQLPSMPLPPQATSIAQATIHTHTNTPHAHRI